MALIKPQTKKAAKRRTNTGPVKASSDIPTTSIQGIGLGDSRKRLFERGRIADNVRREMTRKDGSKYAITGDNSGMDKFGEPLVRQSGRIKVKQGKTTSLEDAITNNNLSPDTVKNLTYGQIKRLTGHKNVVGKLSKNNSLIKYNEKTGTPMHLYERKLQVGEKSGLKPMEAKGEGVHKILPKTLSKEDKTQRIIKYDAKGNRIQDKVIPGRLKTEHAEEFMGQVGSTPFGAKLIGGIEDNMQSESNKRIEDLKEKHKKAIKTGNTQDVNTYNPHLEAEQHRSHAAGVKAYEEGRSAVAPKELTDLLGFEDPSTGDAMHPNIVTVDKALQVQDELKNTKHVDLGRKGAMPKLKSEAQLIKEHNTPEYLTKEQYTKLENERKAKVKDDKKGITDYTNYGGVESSVTERQQAENVAMDSAAKMVGYSPSYEKDDKWGKIGYEGKLLKANFNRLYNPTGLENFSDERIVSESVKPVDDVKKRTISENTYETLEDRLGQSEDTKEPDIGYESAKNMVNYHKHAGALSVAQRGKELHRLNVRLNDPLRDGSQRPVVENANVNDETPKVVSEGKYAVSPTEPKSTYNKTKNQGGKQYSYSGPERIASGDVPSTKDSDKNK